MPALSCCATTTCPSRQEASSGRLAGEQHTREALLLPLEPGSAVIAFSSGAAVNGSPISGGYAGAKATMRFIASYAASESGRNALGIRFTSVLPQLTRKQTWARPESPPTPPGRASTSPPS